MPSHSHHVVLALDADDTAIIATSRNPPLLVSHRESYLSDLQRRLSELRIAIIVSKSTAITWSPHIDQVRKRAAQSLGMLGPLLNKKNDLSVRNVVLLYNKLIRPMMDYACSALRSAARTHVRRLQVLQSKCLRLATGAP
jgi:hypothetical protein